MTFSVTPDSLVKGASTDLTFSLTYTEDFAAKTTFQFNSNGDYSQLFSASDVYLYQMN